MNLEKQKALLKSLTNGFEGFYLAGGALTSIFSGQPINDLDFYPKTHEDLRNGIYFIYNDLAYFNTFNSSRASTFVRDEEHPIQLMHYDSFPDAEKIFRHFDFTINMAAYDVDSGELFFHEDFFKDLSKRELSFNINTRYPYGSFRRVNKYLERGYTISLSNNIKIVMACSNLKINTWEDFKDQLGGFYGEVIEIPTDKIYNFENAINVLDEITFVKTSIQDPCDSPETLILKISDEEFEYFEKPKPNNVFSSSSSSVSYMIKIDDTYKSCYNLPKNAIKVDALDALFEEKESGTYKAYKIVRDDLRSFFKHGILYNLDSVIQEEKHPYLFILSKDMVNSHHYFCNSKNIKIIEIEFDKTDLLLYHQNGEHVVKKLKVTKILTKEEFIKILNTKE